MPEGAWEWTKLIVYLSALGFPFWAPLLYGILKPSLPAVILPLLFGFMVLMFYTLAYVSLAGSSPNVDSDRVNLFVAGVAAAYAVFAGFCLAAAFWVRKRDQRRRND